MERDAENLLQLNGTSLHVVQEGQGEPIVFMHGFGLDHRMWEKQTTALRDHFAIINFDLRGFGKSAIPNEGSSYSHEEDYLSILRHYGFDRAHVVGLSMGGRFALRCAMSCPQAVSSLILLDPAIDGHVWSESWQTAWSKMTSAAKASIEKARELWMTHSLFTHLRSEE